MNRDTHPRWLVLPLCSPSRSGIRTNSAWVLGKGRRPGDVTRFRKASNNQAPQIKRL